MYTSYADIILAGLILILPFIYEFSQAFRYYLKFFLYYVTVSFNSFILLPVFCIKPFDVRNLLYASYLCKLASPLVGLRWIVRGKEYLQKDEAHVIVANHQSSLDILGMFNMWSIMDKCTVVAKNELFYAWPFGLGAWLCGLIFIPRTKSGKAKDVMNQAAQEIKAKKIKLWIFPEGTRHNTGEIHQFKKGAFHIAISAQLPILPVVYSQYYFLDETKKRFDHGKIIVTALPPIPTTGLTFDDIDKLMQKVRETMAAKFHEVNKEMSEMLLNQKDR